MNPCLTDAGAPTYMYEFHYRPSFLAELKPKTVIGDHGDELFSVFGAPFLKGDGPLMTISLELEDWGSSFDLVTLDSSSFSLGLTFTKTALKDKDSQPFFCSNVPDGECISLGLHPWSL